MSRSRYAALPLALGLLTSTACGDLTGLGSCLHSEGCGGRGSGMGGSINFQLGLRIGDDLTDYG